MMGLYVCTSHYKEKSFKSFFILAVSTVDDIEK